MRYESVKKPKRCPKCGSVQIASVLYGLPAFSQKLEEDMKTGRIVLGGCCITDDDPKWQCIDCSTAIYRKTK